MPKVTYIESNGSEHVVDAPAGYTVMAAAQRFDVPGIVGECGGFCNCATCHVYVDEAWVGKLPAITEHEDEMLEGTVAERKPNSRLGCQITLNDALDGIVVRTPEAQTF
ncbi:MAG TPA: 2Fe-2S iron-sulfur cluster-binding protein [Stellaceae bacterium]|nr:2Fe-2S iron-sulfur cluster-binding protein [Stellaceae bacterium]